MNKMQKALHELAEMDELAARSSPIHALHPAAKLIATIAYILVTLSFDKYDLGGLVPMLLWPVLLFQLSGIEVRSCFYKLRIVLPLVMAVGLFNPFFDKTVVLRLGALAVTGGVVSMLTLMLKGLYCLMASFLLMATTPIDLLCAALRQLHVPKLLVTLLLLTYRYVGVMTEELAIMTDAYHLRAPGQKGIHVRPAAAAQHGPRAGALRQHAAARLPPAFPLRGRQALPGAGRAVYARLRPRFPAAALRARGAAARLRDREVREMIEFQNVSFAYGFAYEKGRPVLRDLSFRIEDGEAVGLIGANGAGKSTVMKLLLGLLQGEGKILVDGVEVKRDTLGEIRRKLGFVLQNSDNQMFMPTVYEDMIFAPLNYMLSREEADARVDAVLARLHLEDLKHRYNHKISGGEKRMAAIATILAMEPEAILMDEPSSALDPYNRRLVINTIRELSQTKLITSHDLDLILDTCGRVILLSNGRIAADGPAQELLRDRALLEANRMELPLSLTGR